jgi:hypothetical protein
MGATHNNCFYFFWYFPSKILEYFDSQLTFRNRNEKESNRFKNDYIKLVKKTHILNSKDILISKNPPNTGRLKILLETFPKAKFIFIYRDPVKVIQSTSNFFDKMMPVLWLHEMSKDKRDEAIFELYKKVMDQYFKEKDMVPENQLFEVKFEEIEKDPIPFVKEIYDRLDLDGFDDALPHISDHLNQSKGYEKNVFKLDRQELEDIKERVKEYSVKLGY